MLFGFGNRGKERPSSDGRPGYAFISYSSKDQASADAMLRLLNEEGIATWMAPGNIPAGSQYATAINRAIQECACFILLLTDRSQNSVWVAKETERAISYGKPVLPVKLEEVTLNDTFGFFISTDQIVAIRRIDRSAEEVQKLLRAVRAYCGAEAPEEAPGSAPAREPDKTDAPYLFISYCHRDADVISKTVRRLKKDGYRVWYDAGDIDLAGDWAQQLTNRIRGCALFLAFLSDNYLQSRSSVREIDLAEAAGVKQAIVYLNSARMDPMREMRRDLCPTIYMEDLDGDEDFFRALYAIPGMENCRLDH